MEFEKTEYGFIYKPEKYGMKACDASMDAKFSKDIFLLKSFLDQRNIEYKEEDLENSPFGKGLRIKRD